jgi:hypothetical protein
MMNETGIKLTAVWHLAVITKSTMLDYLGHEVDRNTEIFFRARHGGVFDALCLTVDANTSEQREWLSAIVTEEASTYSLPR